MACHPHDDRCSWAGSPWKYCGQKALPLWETLGGAFHVLFFFIVMISILATGDKVSNKDVWGTFINAGGWSSDGVSFCLGFLTPAFALAGVDAVVHMSEESYNAPLNVPRAMIWSVIINGLAGFAYILTILYSVSIIPSPRSLGYHLDRLSGDKGLFGSVG